MSDQTPELSNASFLSQDNDSHWFIVPVSQREAWEAWRNIDQDNERAWNPPSFAVAVGGSTDRVEFTSWSIR